MRIRKNTKLASMLLATAGYGGEIPETYTCHLNQSPWDVIPVSSFGDGELTNLLDSSWFLPSPSSSSSPPLIHKFNGDDSFNGNVSLGDCNGTAERLNSSIENNNHSLVSLERLNLTAAADNYERSPDDVEDPMDQSDYFDKKSKAAKPNSLVKTSGNDDQVSATTPAPPKRGRPRGTGKKLAPPATTNPYEFYYYSGFGPLWGRKRGGDSGEDNKKIVMCGGDEKSYESNMNKKSKSSSSSSSSSDDDDGKTMAFGSGSSSFDYVEEDYNEAVDEESDHGRKKKKKEKMIMMKKKIKRGRKPVKERSLKSLM